MFKLCTALIKDFLLYAHFLAKWLRLVLRSHVASDCCRIVLLQLLWLARERVDVNQFLALHRLSIVSLNNVNLGTVHSVDSLVA